MHRNATCSPGVGRCRLAATAAVATAAAALAAVGPLPAWATPGSNVIVVPTAVTTITRTFEHTGAPQTWTVPAGVTSIDVVVYGAQGGDYVSDGIGTEPGGLGGSASATLIVTPGETLYVHVGGKGSSGTADGGGAGGFNGGGTGGVTLSGVGSWRYSGGGGGSSDIRRGGTTSDDRVVVAGGGGGAANTNAAGGVGGDMPGMSTPVGATGNGRPSSSATSGVGGTRGTAVAGGTGGNGAVGQFLGGTYTCTNPGSPGTDGTIGQGGNGGDPGTGGGGGANYRHGGGGGGGGYFGGGGGGGSCNQAVNAGGGGGGSSYADENVTSNVVLARAARTGDGLITFTWSATPAIDASAAGRTINGSGSGFPANTEVAITAGDVTLGNVTTDADGAFEFAFADLDCGFGGGTLTASAGSSSATTDVTLEPCAATGALTPRYTG